METTDKINSVSPDCEIVSIRNFTYSREQVFNAWTDPNRLKNWWGPKGFTNTFHEFDLRPGGKWSFIMHGPDDDSGYAVCIRSPRWKRAALEIHNHKLIHEAMFGIIE